MGRLFILCCLVTELLAFSSCKHDGDIPSSPEISFGTQVKPIFSANCTQSGCHGTVNFQRTQLLDYDDVMKYVKTGNGATNSKLYKRIVGKSEDIMPPSPYSPLTDVQIKTILLWMKQGAKFN